MPPKYIDRAYETVSNTPGTASAFSLNGAVEGHMTLAAAGAVDADTFDYVAAEGAKMEIGTGTYTATGTSLSRDTIHQSTNGGAAEDFTSDVKVFVTIRGANLGGGSGFIPITKTTVSSAVAAVEVSIPSGYSRYRLEIYNLEFTTDFSKLLLRTSSDGGSTFDSGASDYIYDMQTWQSGNSGVITYDTAETSFIQMSPIQIGNAAAERFSAELYIVQGSSDRYFELLAKSIGPPPSGELQHARLAARRSNAAAVDTLRFLHASSGQIAAAEFHLYGIADGDA